jgi:transposase-like protein
VITIIKKGFEYCMCAQRKTKYSVEFKKNAVMISEEPDRTVREVALDLGVDAQQLYNWRQIYLEREDAEQQLVEDRSYLKQKQRIIELEERLREVETERDILKKAMMIFGKNHLE